jgi:hypothetical protein
LSRWLLRIASCSLGVSGSWVAEAFMSVGSSHEQVRTQVLLEPKVMIQWSSPMRSNVPIVQKSLL